MTEVQMSYKWNEDTENFCLTKGGHFVVPFQRLKLSEVDEEDLAESLQTIYFKRTGGIDERIGFSYEKDKAIAKELKCWD